VTVHIFTPEFYKVRGGIKSCVEKQIQYMRLSKIGVKVNSLDAGRSRWLLIGDVLMSLKSSAAIHVHGVYFLVIFAGLSCIFRKKIIKLYFHGSELDFIEQNRPILLVILRIFVKGFGCNVEMLFVSKFLKKKMIMALQIDTKAVKTEVCYFGPVYASRSASIRSQKSVKSRPVKLLTVSRIDRRKGVFQMLEAFRHLNEKIDVEWVIIGGGLDEESFRQEINQLEDCSIDYLGSLDPASLSIYYKEADVFWLCSMYEEGLGLVYLEAAAFNLPSVGLKRGGVEEAVSQGKTGLLVNSVEDSVDAIIELSDMVLSSDNFENLVSQRRTFFNFL
jgi:glycosyltransferase involved in cell wall biosynthesis